MKLFEGKNYFYRTFLGFCLVACGLGVLLTVSPVVARTARNVDEQVFFNKVRQLIHRRGIGAIQFQTYKQIINYWNDHPSLTDRRWLAYVLATAHHETQLKPVREGFKKTDAESRRYVAWMWRKRIITQPYHRADRVTGHVYYGRGYVQLTWAENYKKMGRVLGMGDQLYRNPDLVLKPEIASKILFVGMIRGEFRSSNRRAPRGKQKLKSFFDGNKSNWYRARNIINGDLRKNGELIAGYGRKYAKTIRFKAAPVSPPAPETETNVTDIPTEGEVAPNLPGTELADAGGSEQPETPATSPENDSSSGEVIPEGPAETSEPTDSNGQPLDTAGEVVPSLPEEGEVVTEPSDETPVVEPTVPSTEVSNDQPVDAETDVDPIGVEETEPNVPVVPLEPASPAEPVVPVEPETHAEPVMPPEPEVPAEPTPPTELVTPPESASSPGDSPDLVKDETWWGSVKSFVVKYRGYVWKF